MQPRSQGSPLLVLRREDEDENAQGDELEGTLGVSECLLTACHDHRQIVDPVQFVERFSFRYKLKHWNCTKNLITSSKVCSWIRKTFWVNNLRSLSQVRETIYTSKELTCIKATCIEKTLYRKTPLAGWTKPPFKVSIKSSYYIFLRTIWFGMFSFRCYPATLLHVPRVVPSERFSRAAYVGGRTFLIQDAWLAENKRDVFQQHVVSNSFLTLQQPKGRIADN